MHLLFLSNQLLQKYFELRDFDFIYIVGNCGFSKAVQYTCNIMDIKFEIITRENWNIIEELEDKIIFNATPVDIKTDNFLIDGRPHTDTGKEMALYQAKEQFKIYTGVQID